MPLHGSLNARAALLTISLGAGLAVAAEPTWEDRVDRLERRLEAARQANQIPGMAFVLVREDQEPLTLTLGFSDLRAERRVDENTVFALGPVTETFSATLAAMAAYDRRVRLDRSIDRSITDFTLSDASAASRYTISDLLSHQTGLARLDMLIAGDATREQVFRAASQARPVAPFRSKWIENSVTFTAGMAAVELSLGESWEQSIASRLFAPLGMGSVILDPALMSTNEGSAIGYVWNAKTGAYEPQPAPEAGPIAPSVGLCMNAQDMATWIEFCLGRGKVDDTRVMADRAFNQVWVPHIQTGDTSAFALGWGTSFVGDQIVFSRAGSFGAFGAALTIVPGRDAGFAVMVNAPKEDLGETIFTIVNDAIFADWDTTDLADTGEPASDIEGVYRFDRMGVDLVVDDQDGDVFVTIPGQGATILGEPGPDGARTLAANEGISVRFTRDDKGRVLGMRYRQEGREFFLPRHDADLPQPNPGSIGQFDAEQVAAVLGRYRFDHFNGDVEVVRTDDGIGLNLPWERTHELVWLPSESAWAFEDDIETRLSFVGIDAPVAGAIELSYQGLEHTLVRAPSEPAPGLPSIDELMALRSGSLGSSLWQNVQNMRIKGFIEFENQGIRGSATALLVGEDRFRQDVYLGEFGRYSSGIDAESAWTASTAAGFTQLEGDALAQARLQHPIVAFQDLRDCFLYVEVIGKTDFNQDEAFLVRATPRQGPSLTITLDARTGATLKMEGFTFDLSAGATPVSVVFEDYREVFGVRMPFRIIDQTADFGRVMTQYDDVRLNVPVDADSFAYVPTE